MIRRVIVRPLAVEDIASAATWYEAQCPGLGVDLTDEIIRAIRRAQEAPDLFRILRRRDGMRRVLTERFPYRVFFTVIDETLYVHAILHCAQHDRHWRGR
jgi:plasmid stabilization system protein ParE